MTSVLIIGAGEIGQAMRKVLAEKNIRAALWDRDPKKIRGQKPLAESARAADIVFFCIPSWTLRNAAEEIKPHLNPRAIIVTLAKGLEAQSRRTAAELLMKLLPGHQAAFIGGPMLAEEIEAGKCGMGILASKSVSARRTVHALFKGTSLRLEYASNPRDIALAGILKNIYAIGLGIATALKWGDNRKGWFAAAAFREIARILLMIGAAPSAAYTPAGLGDFLATGYSGYSSNHHAGIELVTKGRSKRRSEGIYSLTSVLALLGAKKKRFIILTAIESVVLRRADAKRTFEKLFNGSC